MIYETNLDNPLAKVVDVQLTIYLKGRSDPIFRTASFCFDITHLNRDNPVESFADIFIATLRGYWGDGPLFFFSDSEYNQCVVVRDELQALTFESPADQIWEVIE